jgi:hypothetical protein
MKKSYFIILCGIMVFACASQVSALSFDFNGSPGNGGWTSPYAGAIVNTFDNETTDPNWLITGNYAIVNGSTGIYAAPYYAPISQQDETNYLTVPQNINSSPLTAAIYFSGDSYNYFGLWWGSMDTYNTLDFLDENGNVVAEFTGSTFSSGNGNQTSNETNKYVNIYNIPNFYAVALTSTSYAFEVDNIAIGNVAAPVPEPATSMLLGSGLIALAGFRKKMKK